MFASYMAFRRHILSLLLFLTLAGAALAQVPPSAQQRQPPTPSAQQPRQPPPPTAQPQRQSPPPAAQAPRQPTVTAAQPPTPVLPPAQVLPPSEITVGTRAIEPFIIQEGDQVTGFSADLWRAIAAELGLKSRFVTYRTLPELLGSVGKSNAAAIAAISITADREKAFEFSQPMFRSGLSIMVRDDGHQLDILSLFFSTQMLKAIGLFLLILIIPAHLIWFLARGRDEGLPVSHTYIPGIFDAVFWCAESMGGAAQAHPSRVLARVAALIWIYAGLVFVAYFTAYATTSLTVQSLKGSINGPSDLAGRQVAIIQGSTSAQYTARLRAKTTNYPDFKSAAAAMLAGKAEAVVYDSPVILYFVKNNPAARVAGTTFRSENYGIIFPLGSPLRRPVNEALLTLFETGIYDSLYKKWFGELSSDAN
jgi:polar amino acid transport system substrate-binding protein